MPLLPLSSLVDLNYVVQGDGDVTFLLFNGNTLSLEFWGSFAEKLSTRGRVVRFDQRNAGSTCFEGTFSLNDIASDANALLDALSIEQVIVVAHAWGGRAAQVFARDYPHRVNAMVICGTGGQFEPKTNPQDMKKMMASRKAGDEDGWRQMIEKVYCAPGFSEQQPELFSQVCQLLVDHPPPHSARWDPRISPNASYWGTAHTRALLVYGRHDKNGTPEDAADLHKRLPNSELLMIENAGHFVIREAEAQVLEAVLEFAGLPLLK